MSLYPPLTQHQIDKLNEATRLIADLRHEVQCSSLPLCQLPGDEDQLLLAVTEFRGKVQKLDLALFRMYNLVHQMKRANVPTNTSASTPKRPPSIDDLEGMFS